MAAFFGGSALLALCDCNNFFVSCERLLRPDLKEKPVVVLSANDGCIISRSNEVKDMGIAMGEAYFRVEGLLRKKGVAVFSGNHRLYRDVSRRVMAVLSAFTDKMEVYSIDEAFLNLAIAAIEDPLAYAEEIRSTVMRRVGVPLSVGVAPSKTLAKLAAEHAKPASVGVFRIDAGNAGEILERTPVADLWGVGRRGARQLAAWGVRTASDLVRCDPAWVAKRMTVRGLMMQLELRGHPCFPLASAPSPPKSLQASHSFGEPLRALEDLEAAVVEHALRAGRALRRHGRAAGRMRVYLLRGYISREHRFVSGERAFPSPALCDQDLMGLALELLRGIFEPGCFYTKAGVVLEGLCDANFRQTGLFDPLDPERRRRAALERLAPVVDGINRALGGNAVFPASLAVREKRWRCKSDMRSTGDLPILSGDK